MGVASTGGSIESFNRLARCSGLSVKLPLARSGIACMSYLSAPSMPVIVVLVDVVYGLDQFVDNRG